MKKISNSKVYDTDTAVEVFSAGNKLKKDKEMTTIMTNIEKQCLLSQQQTNELQQTLQELQETKDRLSDLQTTLIYEMRHRYVYEVIDTDQYVALQSRKEQLVNEDMSEDDKKEVRDLIDMQNSLVTQAVFEGAYRDFMELPETMRGCSYISDILETLIKNPTGLDYVKYE